MCDGYAVRAGAGSVVAAGAAALRCATVPPVDLPVPLYATWVFSGVYGACVCLRGGGEAACG